MSASTNVTTLLFLVQWYPRQCRPYRRAICGSPAPLASLSWTPPTHQPPWLPATSTIVIWMKEKTALGLTKSVIIKLVTIRHSNNPFWALRCMRMGCGLSVQVPYRQSPRRIDLPIWLTPTNQPLFVWRSTRKQHRFQNPAEIYWIPLHPFLY